MLFRLIKKISKNYGVFLALFFGIILSLVTINSTSIYGNSLKDSLFQKQLKEYERRYNETAGTFTIEKEGVFLKQAFSESQLDKNDAIMSNFNGGYEGGRTTGEVKGCVYWNNDVDRMNARNLQLDFKLISIKDFQEHVNVVQGRMFDKVYLREGKKVIEVVVDRKTMVDLNLQLDKEYPIGVFEKLDREKIGTMMYSATRKGEKLPYFKVVGIYEFKKDDLFWRKGKINNDANIFIAHEYPLELLIARVDNKVKVTHEFFIDFSKFKYSDLKKFTKSIDKIKKDFEINGFNCIFDIQKLFKEDNRDFKLISNMLWIIQIPVMAILFLYILMITGIIVDRDKDEIALLKSRGANKWNITANYLFDGTVILLGGVVVTPILSMMAAKMMSRASGFMEFNGASASNIYLTMDNVYLSLLTGAVFLSALIVPVLKASEEGIVDRKKSKVRIQFSTWKKTFIDFILIGVGFYGLNQFMNSQKLAENFEANINKIKLDPLIFLSATILSFGLSLFFLRIYPYLIRGILKVSKKIMPAHMFVLFSNLSRKAGRREYTMLFIMILISSSIFNLKIARTINTNVIDNIRYKAGSEVKLISFWNGDGGELKLDDNLGFSPDILNKTELIEPDFHQYEGLESLEAVTKVMRIKNTEITHEFLELHNVNVMAIQPKGFGEIAYMRRDLTQSHWYNYLNVLNKEPRTIFLSSNTKNQAGNDLEVGDQIEIEVYGFKESLVFGGYIDYWPGYVGYGEKLLVGNFDFFYTRIARVQYDIWGNLKAGKSEYDLMNEINKKSVNVFKVDSISEYTRENIFLKAVNAAITISFILSMIITLLGFLIFWCICIRERELQFGILRSLGLKIKKIYSMIFVEQILVTGTSLLVGVGIGQFISSKFLKIVTEIVFGKSLILPILQYISSNDYLLIVAIFGISIVFVLVIILKYISDIKLSQAIKIGED